MKNSETLKLFADPVFKYKFEDFQELNNEANQWKLLMNYLRDFLDFLRCLLDFLFRDFLFYFALLARPVWQLRFAI